jgi:chromate transporter
MKGKQIDGLPALKELAAVFLKLGTTAFGGPAGHIAMMEEEIVRRRKWLPREEFLDLLGATNLIPGPNSTEMAIHVGHRQAGWAGLLVAGSCFILPAALIVTAFGWAYVQYGSLPAVSSLLYGAKPVIIAVVLQALWALGRTSIKTGFLGVVGAAGVVLTFLGVDELLILLGCGVVVGFRRAILRRIASGNRNSNSVIGGPALPLVSNASAAAVGAAVSFGLWPLFLFFLKVGAILYGSGYVLFAFIRADLVQHWHWLTESQLVDAIAVGQLTPGPVFTSATFIGYVLGGPAGAFTATIGIFLPAFFFVAVSGPLIPRLRRSPTASAFLDGVNVASLALMFVVTYHLGRTAILDVQTALIALISATVLFRFHVNSAWLVLGGAAVGFVLHLFS